MSDEHAGHAGDAHEDAHAPPSTGDASIPTPDTKVTRSLQGQSDEIGHVGHYRLMEKVGTGGMGDVYRAEQTEPIRRTVALKVIKRGMDTQAVITRFEAERQALALMDHPNIAKVFDAGSTPEGRPYFVMEYVRGTPITAYADRHKLSTHERLELFIQLCEGVQHAHQKAVIHRDLKPSNVLVTTQDKQPVAKIIDFGVAKATARKLTEATLYTALGELIGTPEYMSPEQAELTGEDVDTRTDVYSLGVILYELLAGALPFDSAELRKAGFEGIVRTIRDQDPPRPSMKVSTLGEQSIDVAKARRTLPDKLRNQLRGDLDWITMRALEKDRRRRYGSAAELAAEVQRHLRHEPVLAGPPSAAYRTRKFVRRHRVGVGFAAVVVTLLAGFAAMMAMQAQRIVRERDRANAEAQRANQETQAAHEVTEFLVGLFDKSDPRVARGETITAQQILDLGAAQIEEGEVARAPLLQARLMETMARVYQNQGLYERAGELWENALAVRRREQGAQHPDVGRTVGRLGWLRGMYQERLAEAREQLLEAVAIQEEAYGPRHIETAWALYYLGSALNYCSDPCGLGYLERARLAFEDTLGAEALPVSWCWQDIGHSSWYTGDWEHALECYKRAAEIKEQHLPEGDPDVAISRTAVGATLVLLGRCREALTMLQRALESFVQSLGWDHDQTAFAVRTLAAAHRCLGNHEESQQYATRASAIFLSTQGPHTGYGYSQNELALIALETGRFPEADSLLRVAVEAMQGRVHNSMDLVFILADRATTLRKIGREAEAAAMQDSVQAIRTRWRSQASACADQ